jgi:hypothetical protein
VEKCSGGWMLFTFLLVLSLFARSTDSALPPGYEDRLLCPNAYCLGRKHPGTGKVGPKSMFWECRYGMAGDEIDGSIVPVTPWGSKLDGADEKLKEYMSTGYHSRTCTVLHGKSADGTYTVVAHDVDSYGETFDFSGEDSGPSLTTMLVGAGAVLCFILFCCVSSALGASSNDNYPDRNSANVEMGENHDLDLESIDMDKFN